jgi:hypothetical protein
MALTKFIEKLSDDTFYYSDYDFVTNSQLGLINKDIRHYKFMRDNPEFREETLPMIFGRAYHVAMLEPNEFNDKIVVCDASSRVTKKYKDLKAEQSNSTIILQKEYDKIIRMRDVLFSHKEVLDILQTQGKREIANAWQDDDTDVFCKGKADYVNGDVIVDLKTTADSSFDGFSKSCLKYGYDRQSAFYSDGFGAKDFIFIVQGKEAPYNVNIFYCSESFKEQGRMKYKELLSLYKTYFVNEEADVDEYIEIHEL